jgi:hypothetical protein
MSGNDSMRKLFVALNSAVGIWFLSTIAVGGISAYYAHFQQCIHDADQMRDDYYKLVHELKMRRSHLASMLLRRTDGGNVFNIPVEQPNPEYKDTSYMAVYWKLREILDEIQFPPDYGLVKFIETYRGDPYWNLFSGESNNMDLPHLMEFSKTVASNDAQRVSLPGPLKRRCGPFEVLPSIFGVPHPILFAETPGRG